MPRQGEGHIAHNAIDPSVPQIVNSVGDPKVPEEVDRSYKSAPRPEPERGLVADGVHASGGSCQGIKQGPDVGQGAPKP